MNRLFSTKALVASAIAIGAVMAGTAAHAGTDIKLVIGLNAPNAYVQPAPVFGQLQTVQFGHDRFDRSDRFHRFDRRGGVRGDADRDGVPNKFDRDSRFYNPRAVQRHVQWADFDRDGVVNRFDRAPRNPRRY